MTAKALMISNTLKTTMSGAVIECSRVAAWTKILFLYLAVVIHIAAPVQQIHHGLEAKDGLFGQFGIIRNHGCTSLKLDRLVCFGPGKFLQPNLPVNSNSHCSQSIFLVTPRKQASDRQTDRQIDGRTDGQTDGWTNRQTDRLADRQTI